MKKIKLNKQKKKKKQISILTGGFDPYNYENKILKFSIKK